MSSFPLSQKYIDFINTTNVSAEFLEGTTASGKTTVGAGVKFMRMVSQSPKKLHAIAAKTTGKAEETIIQQDNGILDLHRNAVYCGNGDKDYKLPHIKFEGKIIYILGYSSRDKWEMVLGAQFGCVYIDEINTADIEFIREMSTAPVLLKNMKTMFLPRLRRSLPKNLYRIGGIGSFLLPII